MLTFIQELVVPAVRNSRCVEKPYGCGEPTNGFVDDVSQKEYLMSGLCQKCQDRLFGNDAPTVNEAIANYLTPEDEIAYLEHIRDQAVKDLKAAAYAELRLLNSPDGDRWVLQ